MTFTREFLAFINSGWALLLEWSEAFAGRCPVKKVYLEISQNPQENACARVSFLIKLLASGSGTGVFL